jgi:hypothetical protein
MIASMTAWGSQAEKLKAKRGFFGLKKLKFLRANEAHRSALLSHQRFDHPPPVGLSGRTRRSKSDLDDRTRNVCFKCARKRSLANGAVVVPRHVDDRHRSAAGNGCAASPA